MYNSGYLARHRLNELQEKLKNEIDPDEAKKLRMEIHACRIKITHYDKMINSGIKF